MWLKIRKPAIVSLVPDFAMFDFLSVVYTAKFLFSPDYLRKKGVRVIHKCRLYTAVYGTFNIHFKGEKLKLSLLYAPVNCLYLEPSITHLFLLVATDTIAMLKKMNRTAKAVQRINNLFLLVILIVTVFSHSQIAWKT